MHGESFECTVRALRFECMVCLFACGMLLAILTAWMLKIEAVHSQLKCSVAFIFHIDTLKCLPSLWNQFSFGIGC